QSRIKRNLGPMAETRWPCPVCGYLVFAEPPGSFSICEVCNWEDDNVQIRHPRMRGGANGGSIFDYQKSSDQWKPSPSLMRDSGWRLLAPDEAPLPTGEEGIVDYTLNYYGGRSPYYWRQG